MTRKDDYKLVLRNLKNKYNVADLNGKFEGNAVVKLKYNTMPFVGMLFDSTNGEVQVDFPNRK